MEITFLILKILKTEFSDTKNFAISLQILFIYLKMYSILLFLKTSHGQKSMYDMETRDAVVVTLESTSISACSSGSLVSKGRFVGLCLRFAEDFETSLDDWKPESGDTSIMNICSVSEGTYEVCSRTTAAKING